LQALSSEAKQQPMDNSLHVFSFIFDGLKQRQVLQQQIRQ
jgi:hypothetical protein